MKNLVKDISTQIRSGGTKKLLTKYSGSRSSMPKMATFRPPGAEKLIFSDKILACSIDCALKLKKSNMYNATRYIRYKC